MATLKAVPFIKAAVVVLLFNPKPQAGLDVFFDRWIIVIKILIRRMREGKRKRVNTRLKRRGWKICNDAVVPIILVKTSVMRRQWVTIQA